MVNKKVTHNMVERWKNEINRRACRECKTKIIKEIGDRESLSYTTVFYWTSPEQYRKKRRSYVKIYQQEHIEECRKKGREYAAEHREKQKKYQRTRYANTEIKKHILAQNHLRWEVAHHIDHLLPRIVYLSNTPVSIEEMVNTLENIANGITIRYSTFKKSIENYLTNNPHPIIKEVKPGKYIRS